MRSRRHSRYHSSLALTLGLVVGAFVSPHFAIAVDDDILPVTAVPTLDFDGRVDDDTLLPHPPPPINVKGGVAGDVDKRLDDDTLLPHPPPPINVKGAGLGGVDKRVDDDTLLPNPGSLPPLNVKGASAERNSAVGAAAARGKESPPGSREPEPCEPVATGGLLSGFGMAARAMNPCPQ